MGRKRGLGVLGSFGLATAVALTVAAAAGLFLQRHVVLSSWASSDTTKQLVLGRHLLQLQSAVQIAQGPPPTPGAAPAESPSVLGNVAPLDFRNVPAPAPIGPVVPLPVAFFPLDGEDGLQLHSVLGGGFSGSVIGGSFVYDADAGVQALQCDASVDSTATLSDIPYGVNGDWAINLWLKLATGATHVEAVFSHTSQLLQNTSSALWGPNQVRLYFPGGATNSPADPYAGILRAVVKDSTDLYAGESSVTFLDSNGDVSNTARTGGASQQQSANLADGQWHMVTLTTHPEGGKGFQLYVDGSLAGQMIPGIQYTGTDGVQHTATGGGPLVVVNNIFLCSDPTINVSGQGFGGRLLELAFWNTSLPASSIQAFYSRHFTQAAAGPLAQGTVQTPAQAAVSDQQLLDNLVGAPEPVAYFPLANGSLDSDPDVGIWQYRGQGYNVTWMPDPVLGQVLSCSKANDSTVVLDPVSYGTNGSWAISLWMQPSPAGLTGTQFEYIYSQNNSAEAYPTGWEPNQIRLYFPQLGHPAFGVVRALVKDSTDNGTAPDMQTFLDSDGMISQLVRNTTSPTLQEGASLLQDGQWHMVTLTTLPGTAGFAMYLDGALAGKLNTTTVLAAGFMSLDGGNPMNLTGNIILCGRSEGDAARGYDGQLAELTIFDSALTATQIEALYYTGVGTAEAAAAPAAAPQALPAGDVPAPTPEADMSSAEGNLWTINGRVICLLSPIQTVPLQECEASEVCAGISGPIIEAAGLPSGVNVGDVGICQTPPSGGLQLPEYSIVPPARAFFPLTSGLDSYPLPLLSGNATGASLTTGGPFGHAVNCQQSLQSVVMLDVVPYAAQGAFSVNLWFRAGNVSGSVLQYLFSQAIPQDVISPDGTGPNQVEIFFPESGHPAFGVLRSSVADANDTSPVFTYLDSNGMVNDNNRRPFVDPRADAQSPVMDRTFVTDGLWHMATVTTQPNGTKGWRLYVDGALAGQMEGGNVYRDANGTVLPINGGGPLQTPATITLCSRFNDDPQRHYDGWVAHLGLYDVPLVPEQVQALYEAVVPGPAAPALGQFFVSPLLVTTRGEPCVMPADSQGQPLWRDCLLLRGVRACPTSSGQWAECAAAAATAPVGLAPAPSGLLTQDGQQCVTPVSYQHTVADGCVIFTALPGVPLCWTESEGNGTWNVCAAGSPASIDSIPTAAAEQRVTASGQNCVLPIVYQGEIITDCIFLEASMACPAASGVWTKCATKVDVQQPRVPLVVPPYYQPSGFFVTNRTTVSGALCRLPVVLNGTVFTNCAGQGGGYCVNNGTGGWEQCATVPQAQQQRLTLQELGASDQGLPARGAPGGFCIPNTAEQLAGMATGCRQGLACIPLPVGPPTTANGVVIVEDVANVGYCSQQMQGWRQLIRAYRPVVRFAIPEPMDFFPLTGNSLASVTLPAKDGQSAGASWVADDDFESVLTCSKAANSSVVLDSSNFAASGAWTLNVWFKRRPGLSDTSVDNALGYVFSQASTTDPGTDPGSANQLQVYMPGRANPDYGIVRTVVKDATDAWFNGDPVQALVYLDTDGQVNNNGSSKPLNDSDPNDGKWHMVTLSTQPYSFAGYRLFLDGEYVGELSGKSIAANGEGPVQIGGGAPILLNGSIHICGRSDGDPSRIFDGSVAHLALFSSMLTDDQISTLYQAYTTGADPEPGYNSAAPAPSGAVQSVSALGGGQQKDGGHKNSQTGAITAGVLGGIFGLAFVGFLAIFIIRRKRRSRFVPFKDSPPIYSFEDIHMKPEPGQLELQRSGPRIERLEAQGFGGVLPKPPSSAFAEAAPASIPAAKASKWEEESEDGQMPQDLRMKDSAMLSDSGHTGSNTNPSEEWKNQLSLQQQASGLRLIKTHGESRKNA